MTGVAAPLDVATAAEFELALELERLWLVVDAADGVLVELLQATTDSRTAVPIVARMHDLVMTATLRTARVAGIGEYPRSGLSAFQDGRRAPTVGAVECFIVERYWPGVRSRDLDALARGLRAACADGPVRYLGSMLLVQDEVVQCRFEAPDEAGVRAVNDRADISYDRILRAYPA